MPKFVRKEDRPTVEAIQVKWKIGSNVVLKSGDWLILHPDGYTSHTSDPDYMAAYYRQVD